MFIPRIQSAFQAHALAMILALLALPVPGATVRVSPGNDLQLALARGDDLLLQPGATYWITNTLRFTRDGQSIRTEAAGSISDFATLRLAPGPATMLLDGNGKPNIVVEHVTMDGNREAMVTTDGKVPGVPFLSFGGAGGDHQTVRQCVVLNARVGGGWGAIHAQENSCGFIAEDNIVNGSGVDVRGNGRSGLERPFGWGDAISTASRESIIRNNLLIDPTDEGIMVQGAPGTLVESNVVVSISREALFGIALIDPFRTYPLDAGKKRFDYRGIVVRNNRVHAFGARVHIAYPLGENCHRQKSLGNTLVGACVQSNTLTGGALGYGFVVNGVENFNVTGNVCRGQCSGLGDGTPGNPPDDPSPFLYDPAQVGNSRLQPEFKPMQRHLVALLRNTRISLNSLGYRQSRYGEAEVMAVARGAIIEILGRLPSANETERWADWLQQTQANADTLRRALMTSDEFIQRHGALDPAGLQAFRTRLWLDILKTESCKLAENNGGKWPTARQLYDAAMRTLEKRF